MMMMMMMVMVMMVMISVFCFDANSGMKRDPKPIDRGAWVSRREQLRGRNANIDPPRQFAPGCGLNHLAAPCVESDRRGSDQKGGDQREKPWVPGSGCLPPFFSWKNDNPQTWIARERKAQSKEIAWLMKPKAVVLQYESKSFRSCLQTRASHG